MSTIQQQHQAQAERWLRHADTYRVQGLRTEETTALAYAQTHALLATIPPPVAPSEVDERVRAVYQDHGKLKAIREYREAMYANGYDARLRESKEYVEQLCETGKACTAPTLVGDPNESVRIECGGFALPGTDRCATHTTHEASS